MPNLKLLILLINFILLHTAQSLMTAFWEKRFSPFHHKSFRFFFFGHMFSLIGYWSHELARSWLVLDIAGTATALGTLLLSLAIPGLVFTIYGGSIADKKDALKLLIRTKMILAISALILAFITKSGHIQLWMIYLFALIEGCINSFDGPAFTSVFARMVPPSDFRAALTLNSTNFHISRMIGPLIAGVLMAWEGPWMVFLFDAFSYLAVIYVLKKVELRPKEIQDTVKPTYPAMAQAYEGRFKIFANDIVETIKGFRYFFRNRTMRYKQLQFFATISLVVPIVTVVFRSYLKDKFNLNADDFGYLFSFPAVGSMLGAVYFMMVALKDPIQNLKFGIPAIILFFLLIVHVGTIPLSAAMLAFCGFFFYLNVASVTQSLHLETQDEYRGRLGSIITLGFGSIGPLMSFPIGVYADQMGYESTITHLTALYAAICFILAFLNYRARRQELRISSSASIKTSL